MDTPTLWSNVSTSQTISFSPPLSSLNLFYGFLTVYYFSFPLLLIMDEYFERMDEFNFFETTQIRKHGHLLKCSMLFMLFWFADALRYKKCYPLKEERALSAVVSPGEEQNQFDSFRVFYESVLLGATAGVVVEAALYPIDTIKTRIQAARGGGKVILKGLYSGLGGNLLGVLPASAIFLGIYEPAKQKLLKAFPENLSALAYLTAGALGGSAASLVRVPTEVVKQRMQTGQFTFARSGVRLIVAREGLKGLYAGYGSLLLRDLPFDAFQFCIYEQLRIGYKLAAQRDLKDPENAIIGAFAGLITGAVTTPLDVIKTRLMIQGSRKQYKGIFDCVRTVIREEGTLALSKGIGPRVLWIGLGGSIFFSVLEKTKQLLGERC